MWKLSWCLGGYGYFVILLTALSPNFYGCSFYLLSASLSWFRCLRISQLLFQGGRSNSVCVTTWCFKTLCLIALVSITDYVSLRPFFLPKCSRPTHPYCSEHTMFCSCDKPSRLVELAFQSNTPEHSVFFDHATTICRVRLFQMAFLLFYRLFFFDSTFVINLGR